MPMRPQLSLSGSWRFQVDPVGSIPVSSLAPDREITVPLPWQAAFPESATLQRLRLVSRDFDLAESWLVGELLLHFGAVDYWCQVFVNGQLVGEHEGGYTPFTFPIRRYVQPGRNQIAVHVYDSAQSEFVIPRWPAYQPDHGPAALRSEQYAARQARMVHQCGRHLAGCDADGGARRPTLTISRVTPDIPAGQAQVTRRPGRGSPTRTRRA